jgi:hypothetical protein
MADHPALVHGDGREQATGVELGHEIPGPVEVGVDVAQVVVLVEELRDPLDVVGAGRPHTDGILLARSAARASGRRVQMVAAFRAVARGLYRHAGRKPLPVRAEVQKLHVLGLG